MPRSQINGNFIDKTFSIVANIIEKRLLKKKSTLVEGEVYKLSNSFCSVSSINVTSDAIVDLSIERKVTPMGLYSMRLEIDPYDRSYILYNIGLIHTSNRKHTKALEYYF
ncbi:hypothetical protein E1A91_A01G110800v1 [Gossypium mustelinum]|uniref:Uncharacterized protein n=1 Tax=Gossypium mustelinum TaxID=34275 RepID=A0A5D3ADR7_GOSMU|nr:hypothetical protein E1A91_A01G110800v1 [Gossypium mustelinum]